MDRFFEKKMNLIDGSNFVKNYDGFKIMIKVFFTFFSNVKCLHMNVK